MMHAVLEPARFEFHRHQICIVFGTGMSKRKGTYQLEHLSPSTLRHMPDPDTRMVSFPTPRPALVPHNPWWGQSRARLPTHSGNIYEHDT